MKTISKLVLTLSMAYPEFDNKYMKEKMLYNYVPDLD